MCNRGHYCFTVVLLTVLGSFLKADDADLAKEKLSRAKEAYETEVEKFTKAVADQLDKREESARNAGDKKALDQVKAQRKAFEMSKEIPAQLAREPFQRSVTEARAALDRAYQTAVKAQIKIKNDTEADKLEKERLEFSLNSSMLAGKRTYLAELKPFDVRVWNNFFEKNSDKFAIENRIVPQSVLMHPEYQGEATASYTIPPRAVAFYSTVGVPKYKGNSSEPHSPLTFEVLADGKSVWKSEPVTKLDELQSAKVRLDQSKKLTLRVACVKEHGQAHAVWFAPVVIE